MFLLQLAVTPFVFFVVIIFVVVVVSFVAGGSAESSDDPSETSEPLKDPSVVGVSGGVGVLPRAVLER